MIFRLALEYGDSDDIIAYVVSRLQLPANILWDFHDVRRQPPAAHITWLPQHLQAIIQQHYSSTWLFVEGASAPARTSTGSKPGIPCADVCFMFAFTSVTNESREEFVTLGFVGNISWSGSRHPTTCSSDTNGESTVLCDTSFADHRLISTLCHDNSTLIDKAQLMFEMT